MPPRKNTPGGGPPGGGAGSRGAAPPRERGGASSRGRGPVPSRTPAGVQMGTLPASAHVNSVCMKRPSFGKAGKTISILTNHFKVTLPEANIHHYDEIAPSELKLPARLNMDIFKSLQRTVAPNILTSSVAYDGRKNAFATHRLQFSNQADSSTFDVAIDNPYRPAVSAPARPPRTYKVTLSKVAELNPTSTSQFLEAKKSLDNDILTTINALNVVIRMAPSQQYPFNTRSFFTPQNHRDIGGGISLWRGFFQSIRPSLGRMLVNIDISTGAMYKSGRLLDVALEFLGQPNPRALARHDRGGTLNESQRIRLQRFLGGVRVQRIDKDGAPFGTPMAVKRISTGGADDCVFTLRDGRSLSVAQYFHEQRNKALQFKHVVCVEVGQGALIPFELCFVPAGQLYRHQIPKEKTNDVVQFSTMPPQQRLAAIRTGVDVLSYRAGQSSYLESFGMNVDLSQGPLSVTARVLPPPTMRYGEGSKQPTVVPKDGVWNMIDKRFWRPATIVEWAFIIFENERRFNMDAAVHVIQSFVDGCRAVGITVTNTSPQVIYCNAQLGVPDQLRKAGKQVKDKTGKLPTLLMCVIPEGAEDIYSAIKFFGDVQVGIATQCMKSIKCQKANKQYVANVLLKMNVKLGGINTVPDERSLAVLTDDTNPTCVMGADVIHPAPGTTDRPSFPSLVTSVDSASSKYIATLGIQQGRREMIHDLENMVKRGLETYMSYRAKVEHVRSPAPKRLIFYRDGVSEGEFQQVKDQELKRIQDACRALDINPKITLIIVGKRHHVRFFLAGVKPDDRRNCPAGMIVDTDVTHPIDNDYYLLSHAGILGTSRPTHYVVLHDDNKFTPDSLHALSFALCHVYARCTRSVSLPAPVYYADIVCSRAKHHYDPEHSRNMQFSESGETADTSNTVAQQWLTNFRQTNPVTARNMYFM